MKMISSAPRVFHAFARALSLAALFALLLIGSMSAAARVTTELAPAGISDSVRYESGRNEIEVRGWAWDPISKHAARAIELKVNGVPVATQTLRTVERPDVAVRFPDATSVHVGFIVTATPTTKVSAGWHRVEVKAIFPDDRALALVDWNGGTPQMHAQVTPARHWILLFLVLAGFAAAYARPTRALATRCGAWVERHHRGVLLGIGGAFVTLVAFGVNGSSMELLERTPVGKSVMETAGIDGRLFKLRPVRGDEWAILMPNVLAQLSHEPRFPIVNRNLGLEGQNMGVVGMTGVPIAQPAAVARPATWGYFFLPLRQAISWHWNFPFFACLVGVWLLLNAFGPASKGFNLALAASFTLAPYAAAWSNWPLHAVAFPVGLLITLFALLRATSAPMAALLGAALGWLLAAWTLVLYPPWQASIGTLSVLIAVGYVLDRRRDCQAGMPQALGVLVSVVIVGLILGSWWSDTREAIAQVSATVYPGQRSTLQGGDGGFFWFLRGFTNAETISFRHRSLEQRERDQRLLSVAVGIAVAGGMAWTSTSRSEVDYRRVPAVRCVLALLLLHRISCVAFKADALGACAFRSSRFVSWAGMHPYARARALRPERRSEKNDRERWHEADPLACSSLDCFGKRCLGGIRTGLHAPGGFFPQQPCLSSCHNVKRCSHDVVDVARTSSSFSRSAADAVPCFGGRFQPDRDCSVIRGTFVARQSVFPS